MCIIHRSISATRTAPVLQSRQLPLSQRVFSVLIASVVITDTMTGWELIRLAVELLQEGSHGTGINTRENKHTILYVEAGTEQRASALCAAFGTPDVRMSLVNKRSCSCGMQTTCDRFVLTIASSSASDIQESPEVDNIDSIILIGRFKNDDIPEHPTKDIEYEAKMHNTSNVLSPTTSTYMTPAEYDPCLLDLFLLSFVLYILVRGVMLSLGSACSSQKKEMTLTPMVDPIKIDTYTATG